MLQLRMPSWEARFGHITASLVALAAACALSACGLESEPETSAALARSADTELARRIDDSPELAVGGETLDVEALQHFYARHDFEPVWAGRPAQTKSLVEAVLRAGEHGLDPEKFHASLLRHRSKLPPIDRDLLLSDAFLGYADALARGAVPAERRRDDEVLTPGPFDVAAAVDKAAQSENPDASIEALAPNTPTYRALRLALRNYRLTAKPGSRLAASRLATIEVNLERERWLPRALPADRAWVNVADQALTLYRANHAIFATRVMVGEDVRSHQTPEFRASIDASFFDPPWVIPSDIVTAEIQPKIERDPNYLTKNHMILLDGGEAEQLPGPDAGLGLIMFDMPNRFDVFLHDTPDRYIFKRDNRRLSHGCIRVQNPQELASLLLREPVEKIHQGVAIGRTTRHDLPAPVPVFVVYETAFAGAEGNVVFRPDFYHRDPEILRRLKLRSRSADAVAQIDGATGEPSAPNG